MRLLIFILALTLYSCSSNDTKQKELDLKEKELALKEKELIFQKDSMNAANKTTVTNQTNNNNPPVNESSADPSRYTGQWVGQGQDLIMINYSNGQYFITLDADNTSANKTIVKAKEENGKLTVEPGISYGYNGISTMTLVGSKKLVLRSGNSSYTYERGEL